MKTDYKLEDLLKMVKKNYVNSLPVNIVGMQNAVKTLMDQNKELKSENESLKKALEQERIKAKTYPPYVLAEHIAEYVKTVIKDNVMENLNVEVDSEFDPYSGRNDHQHVTNIYWNDETKNEIKSNHKNGIFTIKEIAEYLGISQTDLKIIDEIYTDRMYYNGTRPEDFGEIDTY